LDPSFSKITKEFLYFFIRKKKIKLLGNPYRY
jgi:hypothetical protein